jgi:signal peptidase I
MALSHRPNLLRIAIWTVVAIAVLVFISSFVVEPFVVDGISMEPTLHTGNVVLVWRWPQTWANVTNSEYLPERSNLVVIAKTPVSGEQLIKRVIGLPGDDATIANNQVTITNAENPTGFNPDSAAYGKDLLPTSGNFSTHVDSGTIFVMGDNRAVGASLDSRSSLGNVPSGEVIGKVVIRLWPLNQIKLF